MSFQGKGYGDLKSTVADAVVATFEPMRARALELLADPAELDRILGRNAERAIALAQPKLELAYDRIGLLAIRTNQAAPNGSPAEILKAKS